jgi:hypothetical protein
MSSSVVINFISGIIIAIVGAWFGAKFATKRNQRMQQELLRKLSETKNSIDNLARRSPGGQAYAQVKAAERRLDEGNEND